MARTFLSTLVFGLMLSYGAPAWAQKAPDAPAGETAQRATARLNKLFERLKEAENAQVAKTIANDIERALERSGSATADLLYARAKEAMTARDFDLAIDLLDYVTTLRPGWAEPYHRRAIIHFVRKDQDAAFRDVRETLAREPRHYHALAGLGGILKNLGDSKGAFKAFNRVLEIYPHFSDLKESLEKMRPEVEGQPI
jgi:tetratricopeptide (TPR) repeat protein